MSVQKNKMKATSPVDGSKIDSSNGLATHTSTSHNEANRKGDVLPPYWSTHGLPDARDEDGCPVWDPPDLDLSAYIEDEYEKKREVMLMFLKGDKVMTTKLILDSYGRWALHKSQEVHDFESQRFFLELHNELRKDWSKVGNEWVKHGCYSFDQRDSGSYQVMQFDSALRDENQYYVYTNTIDDPPIKVHNSGYSQTSKPKDEPPVTENDRIPSPNDEAEELTCFESLDTQASAADITANMYLIPPKPLALHLVFLRSHDFLREAESRPVTISEEDLD